MLTLKELQELMLEQLDELEIFEILELTAEDLVYAFEDKISKYAKRITLEIEEDSDNDYPFGEER
jgi:hypothetical protein